MSYVYSNPARRNILLTSAAPESMNRTYGESLESVRSNSVSKGCWSKATTTGVGRSYPTTI